MAKKDPKTKTPKTTPKPGRDEKGFFCFGNKIWEQALGKNGRPATFEKPSDVLDKAVEFVEWCAANPLYEEKVFHTNGLVTKTPTAKMRIPSIYGFCTFCGISYVAWLGYKDKPDFLSVISQVETLLNSEKLSGAACGLLDSNIVARLVGLAEKVDAKVSTVEKCTDDELDKRLESLIDKALKK